MRVLDAKSVVKEFGGLKALDRVTISVDKGDFYGYVTEACILEGVYNALRRAKLEQGVEFVSC